MTRALARGLPFYTATLLLGQSFDVASIKPASPDEVMAITQTAGGRFTITNTSLKFLITWAYDVGNDRLFGDTKGLDSLNYDVAAKTPTERPAAGETRLMMQSLLADRFNLRVHRETRAAKL